MGAWGVLALENDDAGDWLYELEETDDLSLVESAIRATQSDDDDEFEADVACCALAACEVLARLQGNPGYQDEYTETVDRWVAAHPIKPPASLLALAHNAIDRVLSKESELRVLWEESDELAAWLEGVQALRGRLSP